MNRLLIGSVLALGVLVAATAAGRDDPPASPASSPSAAPDVAAPPATDRPLAPRPALRPLPGAVKNIPYASFGMELPMIQRNVLTGSTGRLGGMAIDVQRNLLYLAGAGAGTIEVHDVATSKPVHSATDLPAPQGLVLLPQERLLVAACGGDGSCRTFKLDDKGMLSPERTIEFAGEAGPIVHDPSTGWCWMAHGVFVSAFDPRDGTKHVEITLSDIGRPVALAIESGGSRLFAAVGTANEVVVIDRREERVASRWKLSAAAPAAIAFDEANDLLFVPCRTPAKVFVLDAADGRELVQLEGPLDPGGAWYDAVLRKVYIVGGGGEGAVIVYAQKARDRYDQVVIEKSAPGSRSSLLIPEHRRLLVACPTQGPDQARLFVYQIGP